MRLIALTSFTDKETGEFHPYGHEFAQEEGKKLDRWLSSGLVRIDDRKDGNAAVVAPPVNEG
jgi:hypothetical protein